MRYNNTWLLDDNMWIGFGPCYTGVMHGGTIRMATVRHGNN